VGESGLTFTRIGTGEESLSLRMPEPALQAP